MIEVDTYTPFQSYLVFEQPAKYQLQLLLTLDSGCSGSGAISIACRILWLCHGSFYDLKMHQNLFVQDSGGL